MTNEWVYDCETYPNVFTIAFEHTMYPIRTSYEISEFRNDTQQLLKLLYWLKSSGARLVGFNNVGFDYPILHTLLKMGKGDHSALYDKAQAIINTPEMQRFAHLVKPSDCFIPQVDLFKIHHFDNAAKSTSLKMLEFNMRSESIQELPFPVGTRLTREQIVILRQYNAHDVSQTKKFFHESKGMLAFRDELSAKYPRDFTNYNDTKIGKEFFVMELEKAGVQVYDYGANGRKPRQTPRPVINLRDAILPSIQFQQPEFTRVLEWLKTQTITETKGALKDVVATIDGFDFVFGTGGIHGSREFESVSSDEEYVIVDLDVASYYPNLAITNRFYPEHLGESFVHIYQNLFEQRKKYPKKSAESQMLKLALNGVYGDSNNKHSVFYDPLFTMRITLNGQLLLCVLAEWLLALVPSLRLLQVNTDGVTVRVKRNEVIELRQACDCWMNKTGLTLESVTYSRMFIRDVNSYLAVREDGTIKRKGDYEWQAGGWYADGYNGWHQNASAAVVPKVVEQVLVHGAPIRKTVEEWPDVMDFMLRTKVPRSGYLQWGNVKSREGYCGLDANGNPRNRYLPPTEGLVQNLSRYYIAKDGEPLTKWLPPLGGVKKDGTPRDSWRSFAVESGWKVRVCNNLDDLSTLVLPGDDLAVDYEYYVKKVEALVMRLK